jgi:hypothetical protein
MTALVIIAAVVTTMTLVGWFTLQRQQPDRSTMDPDPLGGDHRPPT